jgi:hypothetical protein
MSRSRLLLATATAFGLLLAGTTAPAFALGPIVVPTPTGSNVAVAATLGDVEVTATYSDVAVAGDTYFETYPIEDYDLTGLATVDTVYVISSSADWTGGELEVCIPYNPDAVVGAPAIRSRTWNATTETHEWIDRTTPSAVGMACGVDPWAEYSGEYVLEYTRDPGYIGVPVVTDDYAIDVVAGYGYSDLAGEDGPILTFTLENRSDADLTLGIAIDLAIEGEFDRLWQPVTWPGTGAEGVTEFFAATLAAGVIGEPLSIPEWQGKSFAFYLLSGPDFDTDDGELVAVYDSPDRFVPTVITVDEMSNLGFAIGSEAVVSGGGATPELFPGVEATVTADELTPGDEYELWLAPGLDYFWFYLMGAELPDDAVAVGTGVVDSLGSLSANFEIPTTTPLGSYQLIVGIPDEQFWPAGSYSSFTVTLPADSAEVDIVPTESTVTVELAFNTVAFTFPEAPVGDAVVTASVSTTGPAPDNTFIVGTSPSLYFHLDTTATFEGYVEVCISYDPLQVSGGIPYLYHYSIQPNGSKLWQNISTTRSVGLVCGVTDSFSPFTLGYPVGTTLSGTSECRNGGWATSTSPIFRNQGACVAYFMSKRPPV